MATTLFISYAHRDEASLLELLAHFQPLQEAGLLDVWHDRRMIAGDDIFPNIEAALDRAAIVLLLVSESFVASEECAREMWRALGSRERWGTVVVPVILQPCNWRTTPYGKLNALPVDGAPVAAATDRAQAWREVADGVRRVAERLTQREDAKRRRWRRLGIAMTFLAVVAAGVLAAREAVRARPARKAPDIVAAQGVAVVAEIDLIASDGRAWNPLASGRWRLPNLVLCFRDGAWLEAEICQPAALGLRAGRIAAYPNTSHIADSYPAMTAWSRTFTVELKNRREDTIEPVGQARCTFGRPCRIEDAGGRVVGEVLVTAALTSTDVGLRALLGGCLDSHSLLAQHRLAFLAAAGAAVQAGTVDQATLLRQLFAIESNEVTSGMLDTLLAAQPDELARLPDRSRASLLRATAAALRAGADDGSDPQRAETRRELDVLRANLGKAIVSDVSCR